MAIKLQGVKNSEPPDGQALARKTLYAFKQQMTKGGSVHKKNFRRSFRTSGEDATAKQLSASGGAASIP